MGWFSSKPREPEPDPVGDICQLLVEQPWAWVANPRMNIPGEIGSKHGLEHQSGVAVAWEEWSSGGVKAAWVGSAVFLRLADRDAARLKKAVLTHNAVRAKQPRRDFTGTATELARAVLAGDVNAALALADWLNEHVKPGGPGA